MFFKSLGSQHILKKSKYINLYTGATRFYENANLKPIQRLARDYNIIIYVYIEAI